MAALGALIALLPAALAPPLLATLLAVATRRLVLSLVLAVLLGGVLLHGWWAAAPSLLQAHVIGKLTSAWHLQVLGFTTLLLAVVRLTTASGGAQALVDRVCGWVRSARATRLATVLLGGAVFFDDYANCMLVGPTMRPLSDRYRVSREKLAYLVDSTAAPIAGLVLVSTWVGYEAGLFEEVRRELGLTLGGYALLFAALPFRFYCVFALAGALVCALTGRDFGPMLRAERRALGAGEVLRDGAQHLVEEGAAPLAPPERRRARHAVVPILGLVVAALVGFVLDGGGWNLLSERPGAALQGSFWMATLSAGEHQARVLFHASLVGVLLALLLPTAERALTFRQAGGAFFSGARAAGYALVILLSAWALAGVCKDLGTGPTLIGLVGEQLAPVLVPAGSFVLAAAVAFSTGSAFGTMAMLIPVSLPLAHASGSEVLVVLTAASVLDGAIYGDHCSPISDTTVMASLGAGSDHLDHVATQLPYATLAMLIALGAGYVPAALGWPLWGSYVAGLLALVGVFWLVGRRPQASKRQGSPGQIVPGSQ